MLGSNSQACATAPACFSILWWIECILGVRPQLDQTQDPARFSILEWIECILGDNQISHVFAQIEVSVSSNGSNVFWGHRHYILRRTQIMFQYPRMDRMYFEGIRQSLRCCR